MTTFRIDLGTGALTEVGSEVGAGHDFVIGERKMPMLCAYVGGATHWRLTVVGDRVVSAYRNRVTVEGDHGSRGRSGVRSCSGRRLDRIPAEEVSGSRGLSG